MNQHWTVKLEDVAEINPKAPKGLPGDTEVAFVPMAAVSEDGLLGEHVTRPYSEVSKGYTYFERGDLLLAKITPCFENGKAALVDNLAEQIGFGSTEFHVLRPGPGLDARYLFYLLWNERFRASATKAMTGSGGQKRVPTDLLRRTELRLPPLDEQRRIAAILNKADALRKKRSRAIALLDSLTESIFLGMFGDPIQNPNGFATVPLEQIIAPKRPITYGILIPGADLPEGVPYVRVVDIQRGKVLIDQLRRTSTEIDNDYKRSRLKRGDLLISIRGHVGRMAIVPHDAEGANITQDTARLAIDGANARFVMAALTADAAQHWMFQRTKGAAVRGINLGDLRKFPVPLPPRPEQEKFAEMAGAIEELLSDKHAALALAEQAFASLQNLAFSGQL